MNFLRALFWIALTIVVVVFSIHNWSVVTINLFGGLQADVKLPVLVSGAFLVGFLPLYIWHRAQRWRLTRRIDVAERALAVPAVPAAAADPAPYPGPLVRPMPLPGGDPVSS